MKIADFIKGDFTVYAELFAQAGFLVNQPYVGILQICAAKPSKKRLRLLISVGIHGDETAPIEMLALLLDKLSKTPKSLAVDLMIAVGNLNAIAKAKRFIDIDLNRLFMAHRIVSNNCQEAQRADQLMQATAQFFDGFQYKWHLDLHTAIRDSVYSTFAVVPGEKNPEFLHWLGAAGIAAIALHPEPSVTFSSYTYAQHGAVSCTAELGRVGELGKNDLNQFATTEHAIYSLLCSGILSSPSQSNPSIFRVVQELVKHSNAFQFTFDRNTKNFTEFAPGTILARDGEISYAVGATPEYVLFPNPDVHVGLRAALMVGRELEQKEKTMVKNAAP